MIVGDLHVASLHTMLVKLVLQQFRDTCQLSLAPTTDATVYLSDGGNTKLNPATWYYRLSIGDACLISTHSLIKG